MTPFLCFRALTEQPSRTLEEATPPGRRENCLNMRQGETVHPVLSKPQVTLPQEPVARAVFALHQSCRLKKRVKVLDKQHAFESKADGWVNFPLWQGLQFVFLHLHNTSCFIRQFMWWLDTNFDPLPLFCVCPTLPFAARSA